MNSPLARLLALAVFAAPITLPAQAPKPASPLWHHLQSAADLGDLRQMTATWDASVPGGALQLTYSPKPAAPGTLAPPPYAWAVVPAPKQGWQLEDHATVEADITNQGTLPLKVILWVVGSRGWDAVPSANPLAPGETRRFVCQLREKFPGGTPKLDPNRVSQVQVMLTGPLPKAASLEVRGLTAAGQAPQWAPTRDRLEVPDVEAAPPAPGRRVRYRLPGDEKTGIAAVLQLPDDWAPGRKFPLIVEYPGNIFFTPGCYSNGLPDQCVIGYGITKGKGALCLGLPFVDRAAGAIAENSWGNPDDTADYALRMVEEVCRKFGGDPKNVVLTGFSRGAIACGYIGLRNDRIAALWKGMHACQHSDGDGWNGATLEGAIERARRFKGKSMFHTDNPREKFQPVMDAMQTQVTHVSSGLGAHACAMFLDERPSTQQLRQWFWGLVGAPENSAAPGSSNP
jgi:hypothetical protein